MAPIGNPEWKNLREDYRGQLTLSAVTSLINSKLLYQKALASGVQANDADIQAELDRIAKTYNSDAEMNEALAQQMMDRESLRESLAQSMTISKYMDTVLAKSVAVTPEEMAKYYAAHPGDFAHPGHGSRESYPDTCGRNFGTGCSWQNSARKSLLARVKKGEDFAKLAKENSADSSASAGGDLGYVTKDVLDPKFAEAAFSMPLGEPQLVETSAGYHIVKVVERKRKAWRHSKKSNRALPNF